MGKFKKILYHLFYHPTLPALRFQDEPSPTPTGGIKSGGCRYPVSPSVGQILIPRICRRSPVNVTFLLQKVHLHFYKNGLLSLRDQRKLFHLLEVFLLTRVGWVLGEGEKQKYHFCLRWSLQSTWRKLDSIRFDFPKHFYSILVWYLT